MFVVTVITFEIPSLKLTNIAPENPWLEDENSFWEGFVGALPVVTEAATSSRQRKAPKREGKHHGASTVVPWCPSVFRNGRTTGWGRKRLKNFSDLGLGKTTVFFVG